ncbi:hypothetical protein DB88DRAFT_473629 [Papiliotrema laurentii]|uniref:Uncharacterized protein n=1 Tax=Papiliotrema laurentii TaxID=5418 RepID=A0AAD9CYY1_PAPLA|nr:hypothetical protein DB88DRAFT_473629 [Papiliotrema laurentii]
MPRPVRIVVDRQTPFKLTSQNILVIIFIVVLLFILFKKEDEDSRPPTYSNESTIQQRSSKSRSHKGQSQSVDNTSGNNQDKVSKKKKDTEQEQKQEKLRASRLRKLNPNKRTKPITRWGRTSNSAGSKKSVAFVDEAEGKPLRLTHRDDMMEGGGSGNIPFNMSYRRPKSEHPRHNPVSDWDAKSMFKDYKIPKDVLQRVSQLEEAAKMDIFDGPLHPIYFDKKGKQVDKGSSSVNAMIDPSQDGWDEVWGVLPQIGLEAAAIVGGWIQQEHVKEMKDWIKSRGKHSRDSQRNFTEFMFRAGNLGSELSPERLAIGWFADTYTTCDHKKRMLIDHTFVDRRKKLGIVSNGLQWLQFMGKLLWRQRIFSSGVTLSGLKLQFAIPITYLSKGSHPRYRYDAEIQVFMWDTKKDKQMSKEEERDFKAWVYNLGQGFTAMGSSVKGILEELRRHGEDIVNPSDICVRRNIVFRPGFSPSKVKNTAKMNNRAISRVKIEHEKPKIIQLPENVVNELGAIIQRLNRIHNVMAWTKVKEATLLNLRQYEWDKKTLNSTNGELGIRQMFAALWYMGPGVDNDGTHEVPRAHTIEKLEFGSFLPLMTHNKGKSSKFFPLDLFKALNTIVIPYLKKQTAETILDPQYGLQQQLLSRSISIEETGKQVQGYLKIHVQCKDTSACAAFRSEILKKIWSEGEKLIYGSKEAHDPAKMKRVRAKARDVVNCWVQRILIVDLSKKKKKDQNNHEVEPILAKPITNWPREFRD